MIKNNVKGYNGFDFSNVLIEQEGRKLAILFPGVGYNNDMPLMFYSAGFFLQEGYDILKVNYQYNENAAFNKATFEEKVKWIHHDVLVSLDKILEVNTYEEIVLVCKSIGTIAGLEAIKTYRTLQRAKVLWLTPLCHNAEIVNQLKDIDHCSLIVIGTDDPCYVQENLEELSLKANFQVMIVPDADHSLAKKEDTLKSVEIMSQTLRKIKEFIETNS